MNETIETNVSEADILSAFDNGWEENFETIEEAPETEGAAEEQLDSAEGGEDQPAGEAEEAQPEAETEPEEKAEEQFELNYMGARETVGRNEVIALAQKGRDYDRIREERDSAISELKELREIKPAYEKYNSFLTALAEQSSTDVQSVMDMLSAKAMMEQARVNGTVLTEDIALQKVKLERERKEFEAEKAGRPAQEADKKEEPKPADPAQAKRADDFVAFAKAFPDVDGAKIPKEVWDAYHAGQSLVAAYSLYENKQLKERLAAKEQETKNRERSTGSRASAGAGKEKDAFDLGWDID